MPQSTPSPRHRRGLRLAGATVVGLAIAATPALAVTAKPRATAPESGRVVTTSKIVDDASSALLMESRRVVRFNGDDSASTERGRGRMDPTDAFSDYSGDSRRVDGHAYGRTPGGRWIEEFPTSHCDADSCATSVLGAPARSFIDASAERAAVIVNVLTGVTRTTRADGSVLLRGTIARASLADEATSDAVGQYGPERNAETLNGPVSVRLVIGADGEIDRLRLDSHARYTHRWADDLPSVHLVTETDYRGLGTPQTIKAPRTGR